MFRTKYELLAAGLADRWRAAGTADAPVRGALGGEIARCADTPPNAGAPRACARIWPRAAASTKYSRAGRSMGEASSTGVWKEESAIRTRRRTERSRADVLPARANARAVGPGIVAALRIELTRCSDASRTANPPARDVDAIVRAALASQGAGRSLDFAAAVRRQEHRSERCNAVKGVQEKRDDPPLWGAMAQLAARDSPGPRWSCCRVYAAGFG